MFKKAFVTAALGICAFIGAGGAAMAFSCPDGTQECYVVYTDGNGTPIRTVHTCCYVG